MLVLSRKEGEEILIADGTILVKVVEIRGDKVRLGITCDRDIVVHRREVHDAIEAERMLKPQPQGGV